MKKTFVIFLVVLSIVGILFAQEILDITTTLENSATDLPAFGTRGARKIIVWYSMPDSTDTLYTRITGASKLADTFVNLDSNGDTTKYSLSVGQSEWGFGIVIEHVPPFLKIEVDSLAYSDDTVWDMATGTRYSDDVVTIRTQLIY